MVGGLVWAAARGVEGGVLYDWYGGDFVQVAGDILAFAAIDSPELNAALASGETPRIEWLPYDWKLNSLDNKEPR